MVLTFDLVLANVFKSIKIRLARVLAGLISEGNNMKKCVMRSTQNIYLTKKINKESQFTGSAKGWSW